MKPTCGFRFPVSPNDGEFHQCPKCGAPAKIVHLPYTAQRIKRPNLPDNLLEVEALLDNIRSTFNVGSMFRTADGAGLNRLHLCGITPTPDHPKIAKTALGSEQIVPWVQHWNALTAAKDLIASGYRLWALEGGVKAQPIFDTFEHLPGGPIVLVVGNEVTGVDPGVLDLCERTILIPMLGEKESLNVATAFGIAVYFIKFGLRMVENIKKF